ncbi:G-protein beta-subunit, putative [Eimeria maxima]|uniref:G-protein beta-subunit, putative n=1 Tax=Eimeria maxima TaxID=5804 RepID=U6M8G5_EIMMA|nr:G-protein beta-subunit, putative [Eimeria maxima]CDJ60316.1 G-protein beta-subunit, putative [Eimeria maxima]
MASPGIKRCDPPAAAAAAGAASARIELECTDRCVCSSHLFDVCFHPTNPKLVAAAAFNGTVELHEIPEKEVLQQHLQQQQQKRDMEKEVKRQQRRKLRKQQKEEEEQQRDADDGSTSSSSSSSDSSDEEAPERFLEADLECLPTRIKTLKHHKKSCRAVNFWRGGEAVLTASADGRCCIVDVDSGKWTWRSLHSKSGFETITSICRNTFAAADENGKISLWDERQKMPTKIFPPEMPGVSCMCHSSSLLLTTGCGYLTVFDLKKGKLRARSDELEADFTSVVRAKEGSKVCCGCEEGDICMFSWGDFGDFSDRFTDIRTGVNSLVKFDEDTLIAGCGDGCIRVVQLHPNRLAGILGGHGRRDGPVERLALNADQTLLASIAHDNRIRLHEAQKAVRMKTKVVRRLKKSQQPQHDMRAGKDFYDDL